MHATDKTPQLTRIEPFSQWEVLLSWDDKTSFHLPYRDLRFDCACANCVDERTGKKTLQWEAVPETVKPTEVLPVGRYAVNIRWNDSHNTGIYHFDRLHSLCVNKGKPLPEAPTSNQ